MDGKLYFIFAAVLVLLLTTSDVKGRKNCSAMIRPVEQQPCPEDLRDDGTSCWRDSYGRGAGRIPDKVSCREGERDDGTSCWLDTYGRGVGRIPNISACPSDLRDDGTSCWRDAHIFGKGCCCTWLGCCNQCPSGYKDDGCTCRKTDVGIRMTLFERQTCHPDEDKYGSLCYPKCDEGFHAVGCCLCEPDGGPRIVRTLAQRQRCNSSEEKHGALCYPKCKEGYRAVGCCVCEPEGGPGIEITLPERRNCTGSEIKINGVCIDTSVCSVAELTREMARRTTMTSDQIESFQEELSAKIADN